MDGTFSYSLHWVEIWWQHAGLQWRETAIGSVPRQPSNLLHIHAIKTYFVPAFCKWSWFLHSSYWLY